MIETCERMENLMRGSRVLMITHEAFCDAESADFPSLLAIPIGRFGRLGWFSVAGG